MIEYNRKISKKDHVMTVKYWVEAVIDGFFIDYDGFGVLAKDGMMSNIEIYPSQFESIPAEVTHIVWYNK